MKRRFVIMLVMGVTGSLSGLVNASEWRQLSGIYSISAENYLHPTEEEPSDSHLRLQLTGEVAKDLYIAMKVEPVKDDCTDVQAKNIGNMQCLFYAAEDKYDCHFSINIAEQRIDYGVAC